MLKCASPFCDAPLEPGWSFCPYCGTDNRPPDPEAEPRHHAHRFDVWKGGCSVCGAAKGDELDERAWEARIGRRLIWLGCVLAGLGGLIYGVHALHPGGVALPFMAWYEHKVVHEHELHRFVTWEGTDTVELAIGLGFLAILGGFFLIRRSARLRPQKEGDASYRFF